MENLTVQIAQEVEGLRKKEWSYRKVFDYIKEEYPDLGLKDFPGAPHLLARECAWLLQNHRAQPFNED